MKPKLEKDGYLVVCLRRRSKDLTKYVAVHRLVANAFIPNPSKKPTVNHLNGVKTDNTESNLEWATVKENYIHAVEAGLLDPKIVF